MLLIKFLYSKYEFNFSKNPSELKYVLFKNEDEHILYIVYCSDQNKDDQ